MVENDTLTGLHLDIDTVIEAFSKMTPPLQYAGPAPGARKTPAGRELQWKMGFPPSLVPERNDPDADRPLPFLCFDVSPREWRVPLEESEDRGGHVNGIVGLSSVTILAGLSESAAVTAEQRASYKGPSFETVVQAYSGWCFPMGKDWRSVIEEEEVLAEINDEMEETLENVESTATGAQSSELIPQPENTLAVTHRIAKFYLQKEPPSTYHSTPQAIIIAEAVTPDEVAHVLANGASMFEMELLADAGRMWGLENGSAGDEGELMPVDHACGARIRTRYVWGIQNGSSRL